MYVTLMMKDLVYASCAKVIVQHCTSLNNDHTNMIGVSVSEPYVVSYVFNVI